MTQTLPSDSFATRLRQRWLLVLFALPFAGVGFGLLTFGVLPSLWEAYQMQSWQSGSANLIEAGVHTSRGDDSDTYRAYATYTYEYNGQHYQNNRVGISAMSDNVSDYQQEFGARLQQRWRAGQPVPVWINPNNPAEAILDRQLRWGLVLFEMLFVVVFGGVGLGLIAFCLLKPSEALAGAQAENIDNPNPWLSRRSWASPTIQSDAKTSVWVSWLFAGFWNAISMPASILATPEILAGDYAVAMVYIFPLVGLGLLYWAINATSRWLRFGKTPLQLDPYPGSIGGQVGGVMDVAMPYQLDRVFVVSLSCLHSYISGSGKNRSRRESLVWQTEGLAHSKPYNGKTRLEILFNVDDNLPASEAQDTSSYHFWRLHVHCQLDGADLDRNFEIPVFPTGQPAKLLRHLSTDHRLAQDRRLQEIESVLNLTQIPGGITIVYPAFRKPLGKLLGMVFGGFFFTAGMVAGAHGAPLVFPIVFGLVGGLIAVTSIYMLLVSLQVEINQQELRAVKKLMGVPFNNRQVGRSDIRHLIIKNSYSQTSGNKTQQFFKLQAVTRGNKKIDIGFNLAGRNVAEQALESVATLTGLPLKAEPV